MLSLSTQTESLSSVGHLIRLTENGDRDQITYKTFATAVRLANPNISNQEISLIFQDMRLMPDRSFKSVRSVLWDWIDDGQIN